MDKFEDSTPEKDKLDRSWEEQVGPDSEPEPRKQTESLPDLPDTSGPTGDPELDDIFVEEEYPEVVGPEAPEPVPNKPLPPIPGKKKTGLAKASLPPRTGPVKSANRGEQPTKDAARVAPYTPHKDEGMMSAAMRSGAKSFAGGVVGGALPSQGVPKSPVAGESKNSGGAKGSSGDARDRDLTEHDKKLQEEGFNTIEEGIDGVTTPEFPDRDETPANDRPLSLPAPPAPKPELSARQKAEQDLKAKLEARGLNDDQGRDVSGPEMDR